MNTVFNKTQPQCPEWATVQDMVDLDVKFLLSYLREVRNTKYVLLDRPDDRQRSEPAPDYLFKERPTGNVLAVEHTYLMQEDLEAAIARAVKGGAGIVMYGPKTINPEENAIALMAAVRRKLGKGQLQNAVADERILLVHSRILGTEKTYLRANPRFTSVDKAGIDHAFLIASSRLLGMW